VGGVKCLFSLVLYPDWCASVLLLLLLLVISISSY
jgi:hypothetical protein